MAGFGRQEYRLVGSDFLESAPLVINGEADLPTSAERAFELLASSDWSDWYPSMTNYGWSTPAPHGEGSTRGMAVRNRPPYVQQVIDWEPGLRMLFCEIRGGDMNLAAAAEEFLLLPTSEASCQLRWRYATEARGMTKRFMGLARFMFKVHPLAGRLQRQVPLKFARYVRDRSDY